MKKGWIKMIKIILVVLVALFASAMAFMAWLISSHNKEHPSQPILIEGNSNSSKKAMIVYQPSRTSFTKDVTFYIADELKSTYQSILIDYPGEHLPTDLSSYDLVIFGSPVYAAELSKSLTDYIQTIENDSQTTKIFYSTGANESEEELANTKQTLANQSIDQYFKVVQSEFKADPAKAIEPIFEQLNKGN